MTEVRTLYINQFMKTFRKFLIKNYNGLVLKDELDESVYDFTFNILVDDLTSFGAKHYINKDKIDDFFYNIERNYSIIIDELDYLFLYRTFVKDYFYLDLFNK